MSHRFRVWTARVAALGLALAGLFLLASIPLHSARGGSGAVWPLSRHFGHRHVIADVEMILGWTVVGLVCLVRGWRVFLPSTPTGGVGPMTHARMRHPAHAAARRSWQLNRHAGTPRWRAAARALQTARLTLTDTFHSRAGSDPTRSSGRRADPCKGVAHGSPQPSGHIGLRGTAATLTKPPEEEPVV